MEKISLLCSERLLQVNKQILEKMDSNIPLISEIAEYILSSGGKRIRPLLALSSAKMLKYEGPNKDICLASAVELIHTATLLHDDVVDKSNKRRNKETANEVWGNEATVLVGDFLFSRAFELMVETNSLEVLRTLSQASCKISEGEMNQLISQNNPNTSTYDYIKIIKGKTAELFSAACKAGALISTNLFNLLFLIITLLYRSLRSEVANLPPSSGTRGLNSGGITGITFTTIHSGRFSFLSFPSLNDSTTWSLLSASVFLCLEVSLFALCLNS